MPIVSMNHRAIAKKQALFPRRLLLRQSLKQKLVRATNHGNITLLKELLARAHAKNPLFVCSNLNTTFSLYTPDGARPITGGLFLLAASRGKVSIMKFLMQREGIDPAIASKEGKTALHIALENEYSNVTAFLLEECGMNWREILGNDTALFKSLIEKENTMPLEQLFDTECSICLKSLRKISKKNIGITHCKHLFCKKHINQIQDCPLCKEPLPLLNPFIV